MSPANELQNTTAKYLLPYLFVHAPVIWLSSFITGNDVLITVIIALVFAAIPAISYKISGVNALTRYLAAASFMLLIALMVYAFRLHPWQIDVHMYFFAGLAMLIGFADWRVYIVATAVVAVHHLLLNFTIPFWVFPAGADFFRVVFHAVIVILETAILAFGTIKLVNALDNASQAIIEAEEAKKEVLVASEKQTQIEEEAQRQKAEDLDKIAQSFEEEIGSIVTSVRNASSTLQELAVGMSQAAEDVGENAEQASNASDNITKNVDAVAAASEELSSSVNEISRQVNDSGEVAANAANLSNQATENVKSLSESVDEISKVANMITEIADQTNLLALNATIEAARAGDAGKGFAVVANEVKGLASQTAKATEQIASQISSVVGATEDAVSGIESINSAISHMQETSSAISVSVEQQGAATKEIASNAAQTAQDVSFVSTTVSKVKDGAKGNVGRTQELRDASEILNTQAEQLSEHLSQFVTRMRAR